MNDERLREELARGLSNAGLDALATPALADARWSIRIDTIPIAQSSPGGLSRIGGWPSLPPNTDWPRHQGEPLSFLGQFDLSELPANDILPSTGLLSFFYDTRQESWGSNPADRSSFRVWYFANTSDLVDVSKPRFDDAKTSIAGWLFGKRPHHGIQTFPLCKVAFRPFLSLPELSPDEDRDDADAEAFFEFKESLRGDHQLLGWPTPIQGPMELECELIANGLSLETAGVFRSQAATDLEPRAGNWRLLLELSSDKNAGMMWGDAGSLYFWIRNEYLAAGDFDRCWCIFQCH